MTKPTLLRIADIAMVAVPAIAVGVIAWWPLGLAIFVGVVLLTGRSSQPRMSDEEYQNAKQRMLAEATSGRTSCRTSISTVKMP